MALNSKKMLEIFRSKFGDMNHFHFTIVGDISPEKLEPIMAKYLGNLPSRKTDDEQYDNKPYDRLHGMHRFVRAYNTTNIANNTLEYRSKLPFSMKTMAELDAVKSILRVRLRKLIREKKSGTYGIGVDCTLTRELGDITQCDINFAADPSRTDELVELTRKVIDGFVSAGPSTEEMANYKAEFGVSNKLARKQNSYWKMVIESSNKYNTPLETYLQFPDTVDKLSAADVHEAAKVLFGGDLLVALRMPKKL
jgi:zinc protease